MEYINTYLEIYKKKNLFFYKIKIKRKLIIYIASTYTRPYKYINLKPN